VRRLLLACLAAALWVTLSAQGINNPGGSYNTTFIAPNVVCDGVTDNTAAIQSAITTYQQEGTAIGAAVLVFPKGECVTQHLSVGGQIMFMGAGSNATQITLKSGDSNNNLVTVQTVGAGPATHDPPGRIGFMHIGFRSQDGAGSGTGDGLYLKEGAWRPSIYMEDFTVVAMPQDGWYQGDGFTGDIYGAYVNFRYNGRYGYFCSSGVDVELFSPQFGANLDYNMLLAGCNNIAIYAGNWYSDTSSGAGTAGIKLYESNNVIFYGGSVDRNCQDGVFVDHMGTQFGNVTFNGVKFESNGVCAGAWADLNTSADGTGIINVVNPDCVAPTGNDQYNFKINSASIRVTFTGPNDCTINAPQQEDDAGWQRPHVGNLLWCGDAYTCPWLRGTSFTGINQTRVFVNDGHVAWTGDADTTMSITKQTASPPVKFGAYVRFSRTTNGEHPMYYCQVLESGEVIPLQSRNMLYSVYLRAGSGFTGVTVTVIWNFGTVADEGSYALSGGVWTGETSQSGPITPTTSWQAFSNGEVTVPNDAKEMAVCLSFTSTSASAPSNDYIEFNWEKMEAGNQPTPFEVQLASDMLRRAERYYECSYDPGVVAGTATDAGEAYMDRTLDAGGTKFAAGEQGLPVTFSVPKFKSAVVTAPTVTLYSPNSGASGKVYDAANGGDITGTANGIGVRGFYFFASPNAANVQLRLRAQWCADAEL